MDCNMSPVVSSVWVGKPGSLAAEGTTLNRLLDMLERALVCNAQENHSRQPL